MTDVRDAVVIGAGPAGGAVAIGLADRGRRVALVDRERFPRDKVCGGCLNPRALRSLAALGVVPAGVPLRSLVLHAGGRAARVPLEGGLAVSRRSLDAALVRAARARGVEVIEGTAATLGPDGGDARTVVLDGAGELRARTVVIATGLSRPPAGLDVPVDVEERSRLGVGAVLDRRGADLTPGELHLVCGEGGYVGLVRVEDDRLDVAAALDPGLVRTHGGAGAAVSHLVESSPLPSLSPDAEWRGTPLLTRRPARRHAGRVLLVGDAAGYVEPFTGEGISWALAGARALVPLVAADDDRAGPRWEREHERLVASAQRTCRTLSRFLRHPHLVAAAVGVLARFPALARPLVRAATLERSA